VIEIETNQYLNRIENQNNLLKFNCNTKIESIQVKADEFEQEILRKTNEKIDTLLSHQNALIYSHREQVKNNYHSKLNQIILNQKQIELKLENLKDNNNYDIVDYLKIIENEIESNTNELFNLNYESKLILNNIINNNTNENAIGKIIIKPPNNKRTLFTEHQQEQEQHHPPNKKIKTNDYKNYVIFFILCS
jgi:hypothetical protein